MHQNINGGGCTHEALSGEMNEILKANKRFLFIFSRQISGDPYGHPNHEVASLQVFGPRQDRHMYRA